jgi:hypothetical protein
LTWYRAALCDACWNALYPARIAARMKVGEAETCDDCRKLTRSGIYVKRERKAEPAQGVDLYDGRINNLEPKP